MSAKLKATVQPKETGGVTLHIKEEDLEAFCNALRLFRKDFLEILDASEKDHQEGRVTKRQSLYELVPKNGTWRTRTNICAK